jgi:hypothetical protein
MIDFGKLGSKLLLLGACWLEELIETGICWSHFQANAKKDTSTVSWCTFIWICYCYVSPPLSSVFPSLLGSCPLPHYLYHTVVYNLSMLLSVCYVHTNVLTNSYIFYIIYMLHTQCTSDIQSDICINAEYYSTVHVLESMSYSSRVDNTKRGWMSSWGWMCLLVRCRETWPPSRCGLCNNIRPNATCGSCYNKGYLHLIHEFLNQRGCQNFTSGFCFMICFTYTECTETFVVYTWTHAHSHHCCIHCKNVSHQ